MGCNSYRVILTNGKIKHTYIIRAFNQREAAILAQAEAIKQARGYELVAVKDID